MFDSESVVVAEKTTVGDDGDPWYVWFIKRDPGSGVRTHHIHMVEPAEENPSFTAHWDRLLFRDYLRDAMVHAG